MTQPLSIEDLRRIRSAEGWAELGDTDEATRELSAAGPQFQSDPEVLAARWIIFSHCGKWDAGKKTASALIEIDSNCSQYWIWLAYATRRASPEGIKEAHTILVNAHTRFPSEPMILFNLACYETQMNNLLCAGQWLCKAFDRAKGVSDATYRFFRNLAKEDPDLAPFWRAQSQ